MNVIYIVLRYVLGFDQISGCAPSRSLDGGARVGLVFPFIVTLLRIICETYCVSSHPVPIESETQI